MKALYKFLAVLAVASLSTAIGVRAQDGPPPGPPPDQANIGNPGDQGDQGDQGASFQTFYDQLGDQGTWVQTDDYGYVFQPNVSDPNWAPYTDGHWVYTDVGWTWVSDEPWGWATYHYGRWANIDGTGWVWIPGYRWAPAWVSWRYGGGYCGWAPLPPDTFVGAEYGDPGVAIGIGFHFGGDVDVNFNIGPGCYNFVRVGDMGYPNYRGHFIDRSRNFTVINNTTNITNININKTVTNNGTSTNFRGVAVGGPPINEINAHSKTRIQSVSLAASNQPGRSTLQGNSLSVFAPTVNPASIHQARPTRVAQTIAHPTFNRGDSISKPLDVTSSVRGAAPSPAAIQEAQTAQLHAPAKARIANEKTTVRTPLSQPLTSLTPVAQTHRTTNANTPAASSFNNAGTVNSNAQHSAASSPYTGEPVKPASTFHPESQVNPTQTYHPQTQAMPQNQVKPATTYHPESQVSPTQTYHPQKEEKPVTTYHPQNEYAPQTEVKPATTYRPQAEVKPATTYHPQYAPQTEVKPAATYHPQTENSGGQTYHPANNPPAQTFHPQSQVTHEAPPQVHTQAAPANNKPAGPAGNKNPNDKNNQGQ